MAATSLGVALWLGDGRLNPGAMAFLALSWVALVVGLFRPGPDHERRVESVLGAAVVLQLVLLVARPPGRHLRPDLWSEHFLLAPIFPIACIVMGMLAASLVVDRPLLGRATFPAIVGLSGIASAWMIWASPHPPVRLTAGPRAVTAAALVVATLLIDRLDGRAARLASLLFVSRPRGFLVMEEGWTEPLVLAFLAAALLLARRLSRRLPLGPVAAAGALVLMGRLTWSGQARFEDDDLITGLLACAVAVPPPSPRGSGAPVRMGP